MFELADISCSTANDETSLANCPLLYEGRLKEIDIQGNSCVLVIEQLTPFDHITIPNVQSDENGIYASVIYGNYTPNTHTALADEVNMRPASWHFMDQRYSFFAVEQDMSASSNKLHVYDSTTMKFIPLLENIIGESKNGIDSRKVSAEMVKTFICAEMRLALLILPRK